MAAGAMMAEIPAPPPGFIPFDDAPSPPSGFVPMEEAPAGVLPGSPPKSRPYRGSILPFSRDESGSVSFDPSAGLMGAITSGTTLPGDVYAGQAKLPSSGAVPGSVQFGDPESAGERVADLAMFAAPVGAASRAAMRSRPTVPSTQKLKDEAQAAYKAAEDAGVVVKPERVFESFSGIAQRVSNEGLDPTLHPGVTAALKRMGEVSREPLTFKTLDILRRVAGSAAGSQSKDERRLARMLIDGIDDMMGGLKPADLVAGDARTAAKSLTKARDLWSRSTKGEVIEGLVEKARNRASQFSGSGYENALRTEFRSLANNPKRMRGFNETEKAAIKRIARGGPIENLLRMLGKFAPTGVVSGALGGGMGYAAGNALGGLGPLGAVAVPAAGLAARQGATALTARNVGRASQMARSGEPLPKTGQSLLSALPGTEVGVGAQAGQESIDYIRRLLGY